jgi:hypothetical protein
MGMPAGCIVALALGIIGFVLFVVALSPYPMAGGWFNRASTARKLQTKAQMQGLVLAVKGFYTEYSRLPAVESPPPTHDNSAGYDTTSAEGKKLIEILVGTDTGENPHLIPFFEPPPAKKRGGGYTTTGGLVDVWDSKGYIILLDYDGDGQITNPEDPGTNVEASVAIYSAGPDGNYNTWKDNVKSWD